MSNKTNNKNMSEQQKNAVLEELWLTYYNDTLYAKKLITEAERNQMRIKIKKRSRDRER